MSLLKRIFRAPIVWRARIQDRAVAKRNVPELAVVAIFREEAPFLDEWLTFHHGVGVGHFYLYNNFSSDGFCEVLAPWIARGIVTLTDWPVKVGQLPAYRHCIKKHRLDVQWMAFIDIDEFLFAPSGEKVSDVLKRYRDMPGLLVFSPYFGANGQDARPPVPIARAFTRRAPLSRITVKTIANPRWVYRFGNVHVFKYWQGESVDTSRAPLNPNAPVLDVLRLNHYWSRSLQDLRDKIARGDASTAQARDPIWHFEFEQQLNQDEDRSILPILDRIFPADA